MHVSVVSATVLGGANRALVGTTRLIVREQRQTRQALAIGKLGDRLVRLAAVAFDAGRKKI